MACAGIWKMWCRREELGSRGSVAKVNASSVGALFVVQHGEHPGRAAGQAIWISSRSCGSLTRQTEKSLSGEGVPDKTFSEVF